MTPRANHKRLDREGQALIQELLHERLRLAIKYTLIQVLEEEIEAFVNAEPYQRTAERRDYRNGHDQRDLVTTMGAVEDLVVPRTRAGFRTELFERYQRRQDELDESICAMFVQGVSTAQVGNVIEALTGAHPSPSTVSRAFHSLEETSVEGLVSVYLRRWDLFQRHLYSGRLQNADPGDCRHR